MTTNIVMLTLAGALCSFGASWTGEISDSACGASHAGMMAQDKSLKNDRDCTLACVKKGSQYVLVVDGKVYKIANQSVTGLEANAGMRVNVDGTMSGDTITVSKITASGKK